MKAKFLQIIQTMPSDKAPGSDEYPLKFYKKFKLYPIPMPLLHDMHKYGIIPESWKTASLSIL